MDEEDSGSAAEDSGSAADDLNSDLASQLEFSQKSRQERWNKFIEKYSCQDDSEVVELNDIENYVSKITGERPFMDDYQDYEEKQWVLKEYSPPRHVENNVTSRKQNSIQDDSELIDIDSYKPKITENPQEKQFAVKEYSPARYMKNIVSSRKRQIIHEDSELVDVDGYELNITSKRPFFENTQEERSDSRKSTPSRHPDYIVSSRKQEILYHSTTSGSDADVESIDSISNLSSHLEFCGKSQKDKGNDLIVEKNQEEQFDLKEYSPQRYTKIGSRKKSLNRRSYNHVDDSDEDDSGYDADVASIDSEQEELDDVDSYASKTSPKKNFRSKRDSIVSSKQQETPNTSKSYNHASEMCNYPLEITKKFSSLDTVMIIRKHIEHDIQIPLAFYYHELLRSCILEDGKKQQWEDLVMSKCREVHKTVRTEHIILYLNEYLYPDTVETITFTIENVLKSKLKLFLKMRSNRSKPRRRCNILILDEWNKLLKAIPNYVVCSYYESLYGKLYLIKGRHSSKAR